ncbi:MAG: HD-GYP domain-containing protein [Acidimicrobiales bacterium]
MNGIRRSSLLLGMLALPLAVLVVLRANRGLDPRWFSAYGHLFVVSTIAACALGVAAVSTFIGIRLAKHGVVWLAAGCVVVGVAMVGHGLTTPGVWGRQDFNLWVGRFPYIAMAALAVSLVGASTSPRWAVNRLLASRPKSALAAVTVPLAALVVVTAADPRLVWGDRSVPGEEVILDVVAIGCVVLLIPVIGVHWRRWLLGKDEVQLALVFAAAMCIAALTAFEHGVFAHLSWWDYHAYLLAGFGCTAYALWTRGRRARAVTDILASTFEHDPFEVIVAGYPEALQSMVRAVELKDAYTHGHSARTAELAVELGQRMRLGADRLRVIARGAYLHDLGKIGIPDEILNKPGRLTVDERAVIETHPRLGYEMASVVKSLNEVLPVILHHHERLDGAGYPDGLSGTDIPLEARVVAVADVWDALTSRRAYRDPMSQEEALAHVVASRGSHLDTAVVDVLVDHLRDHGVTVSGGGEADADAAWTAAQTCHEIDREPQPA